MPTRSAAKTAAAKAPAKKAVAAKKAVPAAKKAAPAAKKAVPAKKAPPATKKAAPPAKKAAAPAKKTAPPAKKAAPAAKKAPAKAAPPPRPAAKKAAPAPPPPVKKAAAPKRAVKKVFDEWMLRQQKLLIDERARLTHQAESLKAEADALAEDMEPGDVQFDEESGEGATMTVERERDLALSAQARVEIDEIDRALLKLEAGTYGKCERCGNAIPKERLKFIPQARVVRVVQNRESTAPVAVAVFAAVVLLDQATKTWAMRRLAAGDIHVFWTLDLSLTLNDGAAFGIGGGGSGLVAIGALVVLGLVVLVGRRFEGPVATSAIALIAAGAVGNLIDRFFRDTGGAVVDFVDLNWWPTFNVADAAILIGALVLVLSGAATERHA